jgi:hypothetical protein
MTHTPSNFKVQVSGQKGQAGTGTIKKDDQEGGWDEGGRHRGGEEPWFA